MMSMMTRTILVIEDEKTVSDLICCILQRSGYHTTTAANGAEAVLILQEMNDAIDLVIIDYNLPDISGSEMINRVESMAPNGRIIVTSGYLPEMLEGINSERIHGFLQKPFNIAQVKNQVASVFN